MFGEVEARFGGLDLLVHNAAERADGPFDEISFAEWHRIVGSILDSAFLCDQAALPLLRRSAAAGIIHIGGVAAHVGSAIAPTCRRRRPASSGSPGPSPPSWLPSGSR